MIASNYCFYFTRLTVSETDAYWPHPGPFHASLVNDGPALPEVREILQAYKDMFGVQLFDEMQHPAAALPDGDKRTFETGMYAAAAFLLERTLGLWPCCLSFYSSGIAPALVYSQVVSMHEYLEHILPFHVGNRHAYAEAGKRYQLAQVRLESDPGEDLEGFIVAVLAKHGLTTHVHFKDRRHHHTILIAGEQRSVRFVLDSTCSRFPSVTKRNPRLVTGVPSAHIPYYDREPVVALLGNVPFRPPRVRLIGAQGEDIPAGAADKNALRSMIVAGAVSLLDTGRAIRTASKYANRICVIGSTLGARVLQRTELGGFPRGDMARDVASCTRHRL